MDNEPKSCEQVKAKFIQVCTPFINQISDKLVTSMSDILKPQNTKFKLKQFEDKLKRDMHTKWIEEFEIIWETKKLDERITVLNSLKQEYKQKGLINKAWRAYGHTAEEQTQLCRNRLMSVQLIKMQELLENQTNELQKLFIEIDERRNLFHDLTKQRSKVSEEMDSKIVQLQKELGTDLIE